MIEEIPYPLPTIQEFLEEQAIYRIKRDQEKQIDKIDVKEGFNDYKYVDVEKVPKECTLGLNDVAFNSDPGLVYDFSKYAKISYSLAESLLILFFQELKDQLLKGRYISIRSFGKFWTMAPGIDNKSKFHIPTGQRIYPRYKIGYKVRRRINKMIF